MFRMLYHTLTIHGTGIFTYMKPSKSTINCGEICGGVYLVETNASGLQHQLVTSNLQQVLAHPCNVGYHNLSSSLEGRV